LRVVRGRKKRKNSQRNQNPLNMSDVAQVQRHTRIPWANTMFRFVFFFFLFVRPDRAVKFTTDQKGRRRKYEPVGNMSYLFIIPVRAYNTASRVGFTGGGHAVISTVEFRVRRNGFSRLTVAPCTRDSKTYVWKSISYTGTLFRMPGSSRGRGGGGRAGGDYSGAPRNRLRNEKYLSAYDRFSNGIREKNDDKMHSWSSSAPIVFWCRVLRTDIYLSESFRISEDNSD